MSPKNVTSAELLRAKQNLARGGSDLPYTPNLADGILAGEFGPAIVIDNGYENSLRRILCIPCRSNLPLASQFPGEIQREQSNTLHLAQV